MGHTEGSLDREVHSNIGLPEKKRNISNKQPNPTPTTSQRTAMKTAQCNYKEGNNKYQSRIKRYRH